MIFSKILMQAINTHQWSISFHNTKWRKEVSYIVTLYLKKSWDSDLVLLLLEHVSIFENKIKTSSRSKAIREVRDNKMIL